MLKINLYPKNRRASHARAQGLVYLYCQGEDSDHSKTDDTQ